MVSNALRLQVGWEGASTLRQTAAFAWFSMSSIASGPVAAIAADGARSVLLFSLLMALAGISSNDIISRRAPNVAVYPLALVTVAAAALLGPQPALDSLLGGILTLLVFIGIVLAGRGSMGFGDAKVAFVCGAISGFSGALTLILATFLVGGAFAALALLSQLRSRHDTVAFTPFLVIGTLAAIMLANGGPFN